MDFRVFLGMNLHNVNHLHEDHEGQIVSEAIMSKNRFNFLLSHIMFNDLADYQKNWPADRFPAMQPIWELFKNKLSKYAAPSEYLTIGETFLPKNLLKICHFKRERKNLCLKSCTMNSKSKGKNNVVHLATSRSMQSATLKDQMS